MTHDRGHMLLHRMQCYGKLVSDLAIRAASEHQGITATQPGVESSRISLSDYPAPPLLLETVRAPSQGEVASGEEIFVSRSDNLLRLTGEDSIPNSAAERTRA